MAGPAALLSALIATLAVLLALPRPRRPAPAPPAPAVPPPAARSPRPVAVLHLVTAAVAAGGVLLLLPGVPGLVAAPVVAAVVWWRSRHWESAAIRRRRERLEAELPHVVDLMTAALSAGAAPGSALSLVVGVVDDVVAEELRVCTTRLDLGTDPATVWAELSAHPQLGRLGTTLRRSAESGAPVVESLMRLSEELRAGQRARVEERVREVEVRAAVPLGVCLLPSFVLVGVVPLVAGSISGLVLVR